MTNNMFLRVARVVLLMVALFGWIALFVCIFIVPSGTASYATLAWMLYTVGVGYVVYVSETQGL